MMTHHIKIPDSTDESGTFLCLCFLPTSYHAVCTDGNKRNTEQLSHIKRHTSLESHLNVFGELYEEAGGEDIRQTETKEEACA